MWNHRVVSKPQCEPTSMWTNLSVNQSQCEQNSVWTNLNVNKPLCEPISVWKPQYEPTSVWTILDINNSQYVVSQCELTEPQNKYLVASAVYWAVDSVSSLLSLGVRTAGWGQRPQGALAKKKKWYHNLATDIFPRNIERCFRCWTSLAVTAKVRKTMRETMRCFELWRLVM